MQNVTQNFFSRLQFRGFCTSQLVNSICAYLALPLDRQDPTSQQCVPPRPFSGSIGLPEISLTSCSSTTEVDAELWRPVGDESRHCTASSFFSMPFSSSPAGVIWPWAAILADLPLLTYFRHSSGCFSSSYRRTRLPVMRRKAWPMTVSRMSSIIFRGY